MPTMAQNEMDTLEAMLDTYDITTVVEALADICSEKADHVQSAWQDLALAKLWDRNAQRLYRTRDILENPTAAAR